MEVITPFLYRSNLLTTVHYIYHTFIHQCILYTHMHLNNFINKAAVGQTSQEAIFLSHLNTGLVYSITGLLTSTPRPRQLVPGWPYVTPNLCTHCSAHLLPIRGALTARWHPTVVSLHCAFTLRAALGGAGFRLRGGGRSFFGRVRYRTYRLRLSLVRRGLNDFIEERVGLP
jgi:hypothetical protein